MADLQQLLAQQQLAQQLQLQQLLGGAQATLSGGSDAASTGASSLDQVTLLQQYLAFQQRQQLLQTDTLQPQQAALQSATPVQQPSLPAVVQQGAQALSVDSAMALSSQQGTPAPLRTQPTASASPAQTGPSPFFSFDAPMDALRTEEKPHGKKKVPKAPVQADPMQPLAAAPLGQVQVSAGPVNSRAQPSSGGGWVTVNEKASRSRSGSRGRRRRRASSSSESSRGRTAGSSQHALSAEASTDGQRQRLVVAALQDKSKGKAKSVVDTENGSAAARLSIFDQFEQQQQKARQSKPQQGSVRQFTVQELLAENKDPVAGTRGRPGPIPDLNELVKKQEQSKKAAAAVQEVVSAASKAVAAARVGTQSGGAQGGGWRDVAQGQDYHDPSWGSKGGWSSGPPGGCMHASQSGCGGMGQPCWGGTAIPIGAPRPTHMAPQGQPWGQHSPSQGWTTPQGKGSAMSWPSGGWSGGQGYAGAYG
mmetsp:Transcript_2886/g.6374  ORF Transcript_2886/g.6374 Transcript_2886/m.6374 type:complete len:478 (-) Transcript_2886:3-1436(-)